MYLNLDKMLERTSHEESYFKELDFSSCLPVSEVDCSCSVSSVDSLTSACSLTNRQTVISIAQHFSTSTITNLQEDSLSRVRPSPVSRGDSSHSLPLPPSPLTKERILNGLRRLSLPKVNQVTAEVILVEQNAKSREIFI